MRLLLSTALIASAVSSQATFAKTPNFTYIEAGYTSLKGEEDELDGKGFLVNISYEINNNYYFRARYIGTSINDNTEEYNYDDGTYFDNYQVNFTLDTSELELGVGSRWNVTDTGSISLDANYVKLSASAKFKATGSFGNHINQSVTSFNESDSSTDSINGIKIRAGYSSHWFENIQSSIGINYTNVDIDNVKYTDYGMHAELSYFFTDNFAVSIDADIGDEKYYTISARYHF